MPDLQSKKPKMMGKETEQALMRAQVEKEVEAKIRAEVEAEMKDKFRAEVEAKVRAEWAEATTVATGSCGSGGEKVAITGGRSVELSELGPSLGGGG